MSFHYSGKYTLLFKQEYKILQPHLILTNEKNHMVDGDYIHKELPAATMTSFTALKSPNLHQLLQ